MSDTQKKTTVAELEARVDELERLLADCRRDQLGLKLSEFHGEMARNKIDRVSNVVDLILQKLKVHVHYTPSHDFLKRNFNTFLGW